MAATTINQATTSPDQSYHYPRPESIKSWRADVSEALYDAGMDKVADRWLTCSEQPVTRLRPRPGTKLPESAETIYVCKSDHHHEAEIYSQTCDLRICPECSRRHSARLVARYLPKMMELLHQHHSTFRFRHITFTSPYPLEKRYIKKAYLRGFKQVEQVMSSLMSKSDPSWRSSQGYLVTAEFGEKGHKLHYHVIHYGMYLNQVDLSREWKLATRRIAEVVDVRGFVKKGASLEKRLKEVLKYAVKFYSKDKVTGEIKCIAAELMPHLASVLEKTRRIRTAGVFYNVPEPERETHRCEQCGGDMLGIPVSYWETYILTGFLPLEWQKEQASLQFKPADKSLKSQSNLSPPGDPPERLTQKQLAILKDLRIQSHD